MKQAFLAIALAAGLCGADSASAHHSLSQFQRDRTLTLTGTVKDFQWTNPHVWIEIVINGDDGMTVQWSIEGSAPAILARGGWRPSVLMPGDKISLGVHPRKDGIAGGYLADEEALWVNGREIIGPLQDIRDFDALD